MLVGYTLGLDTADHRQIADDTVVALVGLQNLAKLGAELGDRIDTTPKGAAA